MLRAFGVVLVVLLASATGCGNDTPTSSTTTCASDSDGDGVCDDADICPAGDDMQDADGDGTPDACDRCPSDPAKTASGACDCGSSDGDADADGTPDCIDACPADPTKTHIGVCGCGVPDSDGDLDGFIDCNDGCPTDGAKHAPGICGCGTADVDSDSDGYMDCVDGCPADPLLHTAGVCGCGVAVIDSDGDGTPDCIDDCASDATKTAPGDCGCGVPDTDTDFDGTANCIDGCPSDGNKTVVGDCGCGVSDVDTDLDGTADCIDGCPSDGNKTAAGVCGCGVSDADTDGDGTVDCHDPCPSDTAKTAPGICGCGHVDSTADADNDTVIDCLDVGSCGDGIVQFGETCDHGSANTLGALCYPDCQAPFLPYRENFVFDGYFVDRCADGMAAVGVRYTTNGFGEMTYVQLACRTRSGTSLSGALSPTPMRGIDTSSNELGNNGMPAPYTDDTGAFLRCDDAFADSVVVGQRVWEGNDFSGITGIGVVCEQLGTGHRFIVGPDTLPIPQLLTAPDDQDACPAGFAVTGWEGVTDRIIRRMALNCELDRSDNDVFGDPRGRDIHADVDSDSDGTFNQADVCSADILKVTPDTDGCGTAEVDSDHDGVADAIDSGSCGDGIAQFGETCDNGVGNVALGTALADGDCYSDCTLPGFMHGDGGGGGPFSDACGANQVLVGMRYMVVGNTVTAPYGLREPSMSRLQMLCRGVTASVLDGDVTNVTGSAVHGALGDASVYAYPRNFDATTPNVGPYFRCDTLYPDGVVVGLRLWTDPNFHSSVWEASLVCQRLGNGQRYFVGVDQFDNLPRFTMGFEGTVTAIPPLSQIPPDFQNLCPTGMVAVGTQGREGAWIDDFGLSCGTP